MSRAESKSTVRPSIVPPLEAGDRLSRAEFERRYDATPGLKRAELIEGVVFMPPPISYSGHVEPQGSIIGLLFVYRAATHGTMGGGEGSVRLDLDNMPQPDAFLFIAPERGGQAHVSEDDYVTGAPELVVEVASSSVSYDLHAKLNVYRRNGVKEYVVWRTKDREIDQFVLRDGEYQLVSSDASGILRSEVFPGLWFDRNALLGGALADALATLHRGLNSPEHAAFVETLQKNKR